MNLSPVMLSLECNTFTADCTYMDKPANVKGSGTFLNANINLFPRTALKALAEFLTEKKWYFSSLHVLKQFLCSTSFILKGFRLLTFRIVSNETVNESVNE